MPIIENYYTSRYTGTEIDNLLSKVETPIKVTKNIADATPVEGTEGIFEIAFTLEEFELLKQDNSILEVYDTEQHMLLKKSSYYIVDENSSQLTFFTILPASNFNIINSSIYKNGDTVVGNFFLYSITANDDSSTPTEELEKLTIGSTTYSIPKTVAINKEATMGGDIFVLTEAITTEEFEVLKGDNALLNLSLDGNVVYTFNKIATIEDGDPTVIYGCSFGLEGQTAFISIIMEIVDELVDVQIQLVTLENSSKLEVVSSAPTASSTTYDEHLIYLNTEDNKIGYIYTETSAGGIQEYNIETTSGNGAINSVTALSNIMPFFDELFDSSQMEITSANKLYTLLYTKTVDDEDTYIKGIRLGSSSATGNIPFVLKDTSTPISVKASKYYGWRADTQEVTSYDTDAQIIINGTTYSFDSDDEIKTIQISGHNGNLSISNTGGRVFVYGFEKSTAPETYYTYTSVATSEDVSETVDNLYESSINPLENSLNSLEGNLESTVDEVENINATITGIEERLDTLGDVQVYAVDNLPYPNHQLLNRIYKYDGSLYECKLAVGSYDNFTFDKVSGGDRLLDSEVYESYIENQMPASFTELFSYSDSSKAYVSNQHIKLGSSSSTGYIQLNVNSKESLDLINIEAASWKTVSGEDSSYIKITVESTEGEILEDVFSIAPGTNTKQFVLRYNDDVEFIPSSITISSAQGTSEDDTDGDCRAKIYGITLVTGGAFFKWVPFNTVFEVVDELPELSESILNPKHIYSYKGCLYRVAKNTVAEGSSEVEILNILPEAINGAATATVGTNIYILGGYSSSSSSWNLNRVWKLDTITNTVELLDITLPIYLEDSQAFSIGTNIYFFDITSETESDFLITLYKFDTLTNEITVDIEENIYSESHLSSDLGICASTIIEESIYFVQSNGILLRINIGNKTCTIYDSLSIYDDIGGCIVAAVNNNLYIFGGVEANNIYKYDINTKKLTKVGEMPYTCYYDASVIVRNNNIVLFGGATEIETEEGSISNYTNQVYTFNTNTNTLSTSEWTLNARMKDTSATVVGDYAYVIGGDIDYEEDYEGEDSDSFSVLKYKLANTLTHEQLTSSGGAYFENDGLIFGGASGEGGGSSSMMRIIELIDGENISSEYFESIQHCVLKYNNDLYRCTVIDTPNYTFENSGDVDGTITLSSIYVDVSDGSWRIENKQLVDLETFTENLETLNENLEALNENVTEKTQNVLKFQAINNTYEVIDLGTTYGFELNSNGYYESNNKGVDNSFALCKVQFELEESQDVIISCINSGESNYDFGILSNIDTTLTSSADADTTNVYKSFKGESSTNVVDITYSDFPTGSHFIYIKFRKDGSQHDNNDSLQFKIANVRYIVNTTTITDGTNSISLEDYQEKLTVGDGINITDNTISVDSEYISELISSEVDLSSKQDTLVSGTNIKTINNTSLLGSGNITIEGSVDEETVTNIVNESMSNFVADEIEPRLANKQDKLTAGENIAITNNVISTTYAGISVSVETDGGEEILVFTNVNGALLKEY